VTISQIAITAGALAELGSHTPLNYLYLDRAQTPAGGWKQFAEHSQLETLKLRGAWCNDEALSAISEIRTLRRLHLYDTSITSASVKAAVAKSNFNVLLLSGLQISAADIQQVAHDAGLKIDHQSSSAANRIWVLRRRHGPG